MPVEHLHFVTGRLAETSLRSVVDKEADQAGFHYSIDTLPISVAALMLRYGGGSVGHVQRIRGQSYCSYCVETA